MHKVVTGHSIKYNCSNCGQNIKEVGVNDYGFRFFRVGDPNVECRLCGIINHVDAIREYKDLSIYEKALFILGFWIYFDVRGLYMLFKEDYNLLENVINKMLYIICLSPLYIVLAAVKFLFMLVLNPYIWLPIGIILNYHKRLSSIKRTRAQNSLYK